MSKKNYFKKDLAEIILFLSILLIVGFFIKFKEKIEFYGRLLGIAVLGISIIFGIIWIIRKYRNGKNKTSNKLFFEQDDIRYYCNRCRNEISKEENDYSKNNFFTPLCRKHQPTWQARKLGHLLKQFGWKVEFEKHDGHKHIDIAIVEARTNIEIDGGHHNYNKKQALSDLKRTYYSFRKGFSTLRIPNSLIGNETSIQETAEYIDKLLQESVKKTK